MDGPGPVTGDDRATARRVMIVIGLLLATALTLALIWVTRRVLSWILVAVFFAVAVHPAVNWTERRLVRWRWLATLLVFLAVFVLLAALAALVIAPLAGEASQLSERLPHLAREARAGQGPIGGLLERLHLRQFIDSHAEQFRQYGQRLQQSSLGAIKAAITTLAGLITIAVLAYLMVLQAPRIVSGVLSFVPDRQVPRVRRIGHQSARTITGYISGNLLISVICGGLTFAVMAVLGVPYAGLLAVLVAVADLIPLVGATIGAVIAAGASFLHSPVAGIVVLVFFVVYQQVENHVLQPLIYSRIVRLSPLTVLISVLIAADLAGIVGALLAIPAASIIGILVREARGRAVT
ncbi:AI-2E family transporter [Plantactinospora sp. GCM10030261]|uniref:AI-2E family transporter n=1 Tax=Plantactinospora sp. GCM10030261 TaxID=3273420 RepID=UPI003608232C